MFKILEEKRINAYDLSEYRVYRGSFDKAFYFEETEKKRKRLLYLKSDTNFCEVMNYKSTRENVQDLDCRVITVKEAKECEEVELIVLKYTLTENEKSIQQVFYKCLFSESELEEFIKIQVETDDLETERLFEATEKKVFISSVISEIRENILSVNEKIKNLSSEELDNVITYLSVLNKELKNEKYIKRYDMQKVVEAKKKKRDKRREDYYQKMIDYLQKNNIVKMSITEICKELNISRQNFYNYKLKEKFDEIVKKNYIEGLSKEIEKENQE